LLEAEAAQHPGKHVLGVPVRFCGELAVLGGGLDLPLREYVDRLLAVRVAACCGSWP
jgi:hypothetical protein